MVVKRLGPGEGGLLNEVRAEPKGKDKQTHLSSVSGSSSPITSSSKTSPLLATVFCVAFEAILFRAFSRSESRYSCDTSSSEPWSELSPLSESDSDEEYDDDEGLEDAEDGEGEREIPTRSS